MAHDQGIVLGVPFGNLVEIFAYRRPDQRRCASTMNITRLWHPAHPFQVLPAAVAHRRMVACPRNPNFTGAGESNVSHLSLSFSIWPHRSRWSVVKVNLGAGCFWVTSPRVTVVSAVPRKKFAKKANAADAYRLVWDDGAGFRGVVSG